MVPLTALTIPAITMASTITTRLAYTHTRFPAVPTMVTRAATVTGVTHLAHTVYPIITMDTNGTIAAFIASATTRTHRTYPVRALTRPIVATRHTIAACRAQLTYAARFMVRYWHVTVHAYRRSTLL